MIWTLWHAYNTKAEAQSVADKFNAMPFVTDEYRVEPDPVRADKWIVTIYDSLGRFQTYLSVRSAKVLDELFSL